MELRTDKNCHALYNIQLHVVLVTKYRKQCINQDVFECLKAQMNRVAALNGCDVQEIAYEPDHVHMLLGISPQTCISTLINSMKSTSSRMARKYFPEHLAQYYWKPYFWSRSYLVLSSGGAPIEVIRQYIREQGTEEHAARKDAPKKGG